MDTERVTARGIEPMDFVWSEVGAWPLLTSDWTEDDFDLMDLLLKIRRFDRKIFVNIDVGIDLKNGSVRIVRADQPALGMGRDYFVGSRSATAVPAFKKFAHDVAKALGADSDTLDDDIEGLVEFAIQVANITVPSSQRRYISSIYNKMTIDELYTNVTDKFDWLRYIRDLFCTVGISMTINNDEPVMMLAKEYYSRFMDLVEVTPKRTVANYLMWLMVKTTISDLTDDFRLMAVEFGKALHGAGNLAERSAKCFSKTRVMGDIVGRLFIDAYFDDPSKAIMNNMISYLKEAFYKMLDELDWMDEATKALAREKANATDEKIGYPDYLRDDAKLNAQFADLHIDPEKFFENALATGLFVSVKYLKLLRQPVDKLGWSTWATTVNSIHSSLKNQIMFPAGILQPPFFSKTYPKSMNYGGIGMLIGHEITHGFDDRGRQFDKDGKYVQWWSDDVIAKFKEKTQCIIDQYSEYFVPEANMTVNGYWTQGENIADNGGLRQAYTAYHDWLKEEQAEEDFTLPNLPFNSEQLFFVSFAQIWCQSLRPESAVDRVLRGYHSPARFRVNGPLRNFKAFAKAFGCSNTSYMNPADTCRVW